MLTLEEVVRVKGTVPLIPLRILPLSPDTLSGCSKQFWTSFVSFRDVILKKRIWWTLGLSTVAEQRFIKMSQWVLIQNTPWLRHQPFCKVKMTATVNVLSRCRVWRQPHPHTPRKTSRGLPELLQSGSGGMGQVCLDHRGIFSGVSDSVSYWNILFKFRDSPYSFLSYFMHSCFSWQCETITR